MAYKDIQQEQIQQYFQEMNDIQNTQIKLEDNIFIEDNVRKIDKGLARLLIKNPCKTELFYQRNIVNSTDSPLAQIIVVGMLRTLLTTCATNNKYNPKQQKLFKYIKEGIDLNREWECSILHFLQYKDEIELQNEDLKNYLNDYKQYVEQNKELKQSDEQSLQQEVETKNLNEDQKFCVKYELDRHRIFTANAISSFLLVLAKKFKCNCVWQFSYLIQLITDANGVLVFLKFLTEKFQNIQFDMTTLYINPEFNLQQLTINTIYKILKLMFLTFHSKKTTQYF
ncbi:hypothetical protein IMG5_171430 [Ichthyophthirius multifiliis]|uniref:Far11/STRP C-terminal domain-containing protein n=1 Tax=Ichthyophthirius multifiliis TaxID=5932 RepID=G0R1M2_ICHMU|nr:hypothetical protein IMG5_171430 [Ichthyophthirius multifiliis]EGR28632.1 hypothetical protein IMG5_171430 [Ichthyophthirius multifiliis]|eukprot:XP_004029868.1 hypothetical protein IMG5_171430 [Ichthyophthirius multifiliis]